MGLGEIVSKDNLKKLEDRVPRGGKPRRASEMIVAPGDKRRVSGLYYITNDADERIPVQVNGAHSGSTYKESLVDGAVVKSGIKFQYFIIPELLDQGTDRVLIAINYSPDKERPILVQQPDPRPTERGLRRGMSVASDTLRRVGHAISSRLVNPTYYRDELQFWPDFFNAEGNVKEAREIESDLPAEFAEIVRMHAEGAQISYCNLGSKNGREVRNGSIPENLIMPASIPVVAADAELSA